MGNKDTSKKKNPFVCWTEMWKRSFDFKGKSTRREFICGLLINLAVAALLPIVFLVIFYGRNMFLFLPTALFSVVSLLPLSALTVRRLHDLGKSGKWAILALGFLIGLIILLSLCLRPQGLRPFDPADNIVVGVYGPPSEYEFEEYTETEITTVSETESLRDFIVKENIEANVYGPPAYFE